MKEVQVWRDDQESAATKAMKSEAADRLSTNRTSSIRRDLMDFGEYVACPAIKRYWIRREEKHEHRSGG